MKYRVSLFESDVSQSFKVFIAGGVAVDTTINGESGTYEFDVPTGKEFRVELGLDNLVLYGGDLANGPIEKKAFKVECLDSTTTPEPIRTTADANEDLSVTDSFEGNVSFETKQEQDHFYKEESQEED